MDIFLSFVGVVVVGLLIVIVVLLFRRQPSGDSSAAFNNLSQQIQAGQNQIVLADQKLTRIEPLVTQLPSELTRVAERISQVEQAQRNIEQQVQSVETRVAQGSTENSNLISSAEAMRSQLTDATTRLAEIQNEAQARRIIEQRTADSIRKLETIMTGSSSKGAAGENIIASIFAQFPPDMREYNYSVGGSRVEFALKLSNGLILPIDSKWPATNLLEQYSSSSDDNERGRLKRRIEDAVEDKAKEVTRYINPNITVNFAVAVIPDVVYELCTDVHVKALNNNVALIAHSMLVPYLLLVLRTIQKTTATIDEQKLNASLEVAQKCIQEMQAELQGRLSKVITMVTNSRNDMSNQLGKMHQVLNNLSTITGVEPTATIVKENQLAEI